MSLKRKSFLLLMSIAVVFGADKEDARFEPEQASSYASHQTISKVTIAAEALETDEQTRPAFGKLKPTEHGILPILVVIQNDGDQTLSLEDMKVEYLGQDRRRIEPTPAGELKYIYGAREPTVVSSPLPRIPGLSRKKNPLDTWEIEGRAFVARVLPPGESASGIFYFRVNHRNGASLYLTTIRELPSRNELFYFEIPLESAGR